MKLNYKLLGDYIQEVNVRNSELKDLNLLGISIQKEFIPSIANTIGTDMSKYKIVKKNQFAYGTVTSRNGDKISIALLQNHEEALISQAYVSFEIIDENELLPEYLMMWFRRPEFDRYARYMSYGSAREVFSWEEMCNVKLPVPSIEKQRKIVKEYNYVLNKIKLNENTIEKLEDLSQSIYKQFFEINEDFEYETKSLKDITISITDGKHGDCENKSNSGYYFISVKDIVNGEISYDNARQITKNDFEETNRRTNVESGDILLTNSGTIGRMAIVKDIPETKKTTFQKSVAIIKPNQSIAPTNYLYSVLKFRINEIRELAGGSTQSNLLLGDLRKIDIKCHDKNIIKDYESKVKPIFEYRSLLGEEQKKLFKLKDILLSKVSNTGE